MRRDHWTRLRRCNVGPIAGVLGIVLAASGLRIEATAEAVSWWGLMSEGLTHSEEHGSPRNVLEVEILQLQGSSEFQALVAYVAGLPEEPTTESLCRLMEDHEWREAQCILWVRFHLQDGDSIDIGYTIRPYPDPEAAYAFPQILALARLVGDQVRLGSPGCVLDGYQAAELLRIRSNR